MNRTILGIGFTILSITTSMGQDVNNKAYDLMLKGMLSNSVERVNVESASQESKAVFIDSREEREYEVSHIENAKWVGYDQLDLSAVKELPKDTPLIVYCSVGYRSEKVAEKLKSNGFTNVKNLYGGIFEWVNQEHAVVDEKNQETKQVHAYSKMWGVWLNKGEKVYE